MKQAVKVAKARIIIIFSEVVPFVSKFFGFVVIDNFKIHFSCVQEIQRLQRREGEKPMSGLKGNGPPRAVHRSLRVR
jgi:hypothetical protein